MEDFVSCVKIAVYCVLNDPEKVANGEPKYLGFNFVVRRNEVSEMVRFIKETLDIFDVPYESVDVYGNIELPIVKVWDKERIIKAIKESKDYLINEFKKYTKQK